MRNHRKLTRQKYCLGPTETGAAQVFTLPILDIPSPALRSDAENAAPVRMQLLPISLMLNQTDKDQIVKTRFKQLCNAFFSIIGQDMPRTRVAPNMLEAYKEILLNRSAADKICEILFGCPAIDEKQTTPPQEGCFDSYFESRFLHSEQSFIAALAQIRHDKLLHVSAKWLHSLRKLKTGGLALQFQATKKIRLHLISQKDMWHSCRGSLSFLLGSGGDQPSWLSEHMGRFFSVLARTLKIPIPASALEIEMYASGIEFSST